MPSYKSTVLTLAVEVGGQLAAAVQSDPPEPAFPQC